MACDLDGVDFQALEERLVEETALARVGLPVGGLDVFGQGERDVERAEELVAVEGQLGDHLLGGDTFAGDALLLAVVETLGDPFGVVALEQLAFLVLHAAERALGASDLDVGGPGQLIEAGSDVLCDTPTLAVAELDVDVVALDRRLDLLDAVPALFADALLASAAHEVVILPAVAAYPHEEQATLALPAEQGSTQVAVVAPAALAALTLRGQHLLNQPEDLGCHQRLVAASVGLAVVVDDPDVIVVSQDGREAVGAQHPRRASASLAAAQPAWSATGTSSSSQTTSWPPEPPSTSTASNASPASPRPTA